MKLADCMNIMNINMNELEHLDVFKLRKQYYKLAREKHPDKGGSEADFKELREAYVNLNEVLLSKIEKKPLEPSEKLRYFELFRSFLEDEHIRGYLYDKLLPIIQRIMKDVQEFSIQQLLKHMVPHRKKNNEDAKVNKIIELTPTITDLVENNIYKYNYKDTYFLIPLWHSEVHFEYEEEEIVFICNPILPENYFIDNFNNLHIIIEEKLSNIGCCEFLTVECGSQINQLPISDLFIRKFQTITIPKGGLSNINLHDIYNVTHKMDLHVHIYLDLNCNTA